MKNNISPIFITGSVRSGTSIVNQALIHGAKIPGYDEGCFVDFLGYFLKFIDTRYGSRAQQMLRAELMLSDVNIEKFKKDFLDWFIDQYINYSKYDGVFVDKTPTIETLYAAPFIIDAIPTSKFIFMKRRGIENIVSRMKKFPELSFEKHCLLWTEIMDLIVILQERLPRDSFILIDQYNISKIPEETATKIGLFLNLNVDQIEKIEKIFRNNRPEHSGATEDDIKSLESLEWTDDQKSFFKKTCGPIMDHFGWSLDENYFKI